MAKTNSDFQFLAFPIGYEVTVGSEDQLQNFLKGIFVQEGSSGTRFDHGQFEIKTFLIYALPYWSMSSINMHTPRFHIKGILKNFKIWIICIYL